VVRHDADLQDFDPRRRMSKSNTLDTFAVLGDSLKSKASNALKPRAEHEFGVRGTSPNRMPTVRYKTSGLADPLKIQADGGQSGYASAQAEKGNGFGHGQGGAQERPTRNRTFSADRLSTFVASTQTHYQEGTTSSTGTKGAFHSRTGSVPIGHALNRTGTVPHLHASDPYASKFMQKAAQKTPFVEAIASQRAQAAHYAYLRHSWNRIDLVAVIGFWITFILCMFGTENTANHHIYIFRALSVLRASRLLTATSGTSTILNSLKQAGPLLANVLFFTVFAMLLFSVIGLQSFKGSYRRSCVYFSDVPELSSGLPPGAIPGLMPGGPNNVTLSQICGGFINATTNEARGHLTTDRKPESLSPKGYICPTGQVCVESKQNPENGVLSFDDIFASLLQVVIIISSNNWSQTMYDMIDADYYASCLYFVIGLILLNFFLANLFVAVITNTFSVITGETKQIQVSDP